MMKQRSFLIIKIVLLDSGDWRTALCDERGAAKAESGAGGRGMKTTRKLHS